jgi:type I restriction enzyme S subunit
VYFHEAATDADLRFFLYLLQHKALRRLDKSTAVPGLSRDDYDVVPVDLPPEAEQHRIADALDSYLSRLDAAVATLEAAQTKLKAYRASVLKAAVEGRLVPTEAALAGAEKRDFEPADVLLKRILAERRRRWEEAELAKLKAAGKSPKDDKWKAKYEEPEAPDVKGLPELPEGWCWASFEQLTSLITSGSRGWAEYYAEKGATFIRAQDIKTDALVLEHIARVTPPEGAEGARTAVHRSDLLVTITGANVTKTALVEQDVGEAYVSQHVGLCRPVETGIAPYLHTFVVCPSAGRRFLEKAAYGAGKPGLNLDNLKQVVVALPPFSESERIVDAVDELVGDARHDELVAAHAIRRIGRLRQSILKWAFEGKLVDQDPNDEPAERLLERIRTERANAGAAKKSPRGNAAVPT